MEKFSACFVVVVLFGFFGLFFATAAGITSVTTGIIMTPIVTLSLFAGLDLCRIICRWIARRVNLHGCEGHLVLIICMVCIGLPLTEVLSFINIVYPGHLGIIHTDADAWRIAAGLGLVVGFFRFNKFPVSINSLSHFVARRFRGEW